jgi:hypothetical protein
MKNYTCLHADYCILLLFNLGVNDDNGGQAATAVTYRMISHTSISFSNIAGPVEEVEFFGHPIVHLIPTVSGHPHSLTIHFQSYMERVVLVVTAASEVIRDPKQLCIDCVDAFDRMKQAAVAGHVICYES